MAKAVWPQLESTLENEKENQNIPLNALQDALADAVVFLLRIGARSLDVLLFDRGLEEATEGSYDAVLGGGGGGSRGVFRLWCLGLRFDSLRRILRRWNLCCRDVFGGSFMFEVFSEARIELLDGVVFVGGSPEPTHCDLSFQQ